MTDADNLIPTPTPVGRKGFPIKIIPGTNSPRSIEGRDYSSHAIDRIQERGFTPSVVENTIQSGQSIPGKMPGTTSHYDPVNNVTVITDTASGRVITMTYGEIKQQE
jgi:hypothetical protein